MSKLSQSPESKCIGFNVSIPFSDLQRIETAVKKAGISRSEWIRRAVKHYYYRSDEPK